MDVASVLLARAAALGRRSIVVVGTGKNVGKTVTARALAQAAVAAGHTVGFTSIGRDGESVDMATAGAKPRLIFGPGTLLATATDTLRGAPAGEVLEIGEEAGPLGRIALIRVVRRGAYEIAGPNTAAGIRAAVARLSELGAACVVVDGAIDRMAALAGGDDAVVVASGAARGGSAAHIAVELASLVARLSIPEHDGTPALHVAGALTEDAVEQLIAAGDSRRVVLEDPTKLMLRGRLVMRARERLDLRVLRPIRVIGCTLAAIDRERALDVRALLQAVWAATGVPAYDVFSGEAAA